MRCSLTRWLTKESLQSISERSDGLVSDIGSVQERRVGAAKNEASPIDNIEPELVHHKARRCGPCPNRFSVTGSTPRTELLHVEVLSHLRRQVVFVANR